MKPPPAFPHSRAEFSIAIPAPGADGLIVVMKPEVRGHDARIRFFNADGSEAEMSGNGIRCAGAFLVERKPQKRTLEIETLAGVKTLEKGKSSAGKWMFRVRMGAPILTAAQIPFQPAETASPLLRFPLKTHRGDLPVTVTSMGNPHCSVFVADFETVDWLRLGREIEQNEHFPNRTNVEFVRLISRDEIEVQILGAGSWATRSRQGRVPVAPRCLPFSTVSRTGACTCGPRPACWKWRGRRVARLR